MPGGMLSLLCRPELLRSGRQNVVGETGTDEALAAKKSRQSEELAMQTSVEKTAKPARLNATSMELCDLAETCEAMCDKLRAVLQSA